MPALRLTLQFADSYQDPKVAEDLHQIVAAIQTWAQASANWIDVPFAPGLITTNGTGLATLVGSQPFVCRYRILSNEMLWLLSLKVTIGNTTTTEIRVGLPSTYTALATNFLSGDDDNQQAATGIWNGGGSGGVIGAFINAGHNYISLQRWDGTPVAAFPNGTTCVLRAMITIPLAQPAQ